jgi:hypothetical protein
MTSTLPRPQGSGNSYLKQRIEGVFLYKVFAGKGKRPYFEKEFYSGIKKQIKSYKNLMTIYVS